MAAKGALIDAAIFGAAEGHAVMFKFDHRRDRFAAHIFNGVLVAQPVGALHRVIHVPAPVIRPHVGQRGGNAALSRDGVRARRKHLGDAGGPEPGLRSAQRRAQARAARTDHHHIVAVVGHRIGASAD